MVDMGVPGYLGASSVIAVMAQRLVRVICNRCKQSYQPSEAVLEDAGISLEDAKNANFARGKGCGYCQRKGFRGRQGIFEMMIVSAKIRELIFNNQSSVDIRKVAVKEGMQTLYLDGLEKVKEGVTTLEEVTRVSKRSEEDIAHAGT